MNNYVVDVEEMPEVIKANSLKEAIKIAFAHVGVREMQKEEFEVYGVVE